MRRVSLSSDSLAFADTDAPLFALKRAADRIVAHLTFPRPKRRDAAGTVWIVGAGPGDPDLLTVKALRLLRRADVVVHDDLVSEEILALLPFRTRRICVGKRSGRPSTPQDRINALLVTLTRRHRCVVRLKGGDPAIFARTGEELCHLRLNGIHAQMVPGITAASGAAAAAGMPLTCRGMASEFCVVSAHGRTSELPGLDWKHLASPGTTVALYMPRKHLDHIARKLMDEGRSPETPVMLIENATCAAERRLSLPLESLAEQGLVQLDVLDGTPLLVLVGEVVALARGVPARAPAL